MSTQATTNAANTADAQEAPRVLTHVNIAVSPALIERMAAAAWERHATMPWDVIPAAWKPFYLEAMEAALLAVLKP